MQFTLPTLALLIASVAGTPTPLEVEPRAVDAVVGATNALAPLVTVELTYCKNTNFNTCRTVAATIGTCHNLLPEWDNQSSSARPQQGGGPVCRLFANPSCSGTFIDLRYPGVGDLGAVSFDNLLSSYKCT